MNTASTDNVSNLSIVEPVRGRFEIGDKIIVCVFTNTRDGFVEQFINASIGSINKNFIRADMYELSSGAFIPSVKQRYIPISSYIEPDDFEYEYQDLYDKVENGTMPLIEKTLFMHVVDGNGAIQQVPPVDTKKVEAEIKDVFERMGDSTFTEPKKFDIRNVCLIISLIAFALALAACFR